MTTFLQYKHCPLHLLAASQPYCNHLQISAPFQATCGISLQHAPMKKESQAIRTGIINQHPQDCGDVKNRLGGLCKPSQTLFSGSAYTALC